MTAQQLRIVTIVLTAVAAFLAFLLGGAQSVGISPMVALILGSVLAAINVAVGYLPSFAGASGIEPGKTEKEVSRRAYTAGQKNDPIPRGLV